MAKQDIFRPDRKQKRRPIICIESQQVFPSAVELAEHLNICTQHAYHLARSHRVHRGVHYAYIEPDGTQNCT